MWKLCARASSSYQAFSSPWYEAITIGHDTMHDKNKTLLKIITVKCDI